MALVTWDWMLRPLPPVEGERRPPRRPLNESLGSLASGARGEDERKAKSFLRR
jgi:hypothetical protein